jgi:hypothetical protein
MSIMNLEHQIDARYDFEGNLYKDPCIYTADGRHNFTYDGRGNNSCTLCGIISHIDTYAEPTDWEIAQIRRKPTTRPYDRRDYWNERMRQFKCEEPTIPISISNAILDQASMQKVYGPPRTFNRSVFHKVLR